MLGSGADAHFMEHWLYYRHYISFKNKSSLYEKFDSYRHYGNTFDDLKDVEHSRTWKINYFSDETGHKMLTSNLNSNSYRLMMETWNWL